MRQMLVHSVVACWIQYIYRNIFFFFGVKMKLNIGLIDTYRSRREVISEKSVLVW